MIEKSINQFYENGFKIIHMGFEDKLFMYHKTNDLDQAIFISFDNIILSVNSAKNKSSFIFKDDFVEDAKSKKSETKFTIDSNSVTIESVGPDNKNKLKTNKIVFKNHDVINFISDMLYKYLIHIERDYRAETDDTKRKSLRKKFEKTTKFLEGGFTCDR